MTKEEIRRAFVEAVDETLRSELQRRRAGFRVKGLGEVAFGDFLARLQKLGAGDYETPCDHPHHEESA